jgi:hypothetical protein
VFPAHIKSLIQCALFVGRCCSIGCGNPAWLLLGLLGGVN